MDGIVTLSGFTVLSVKLKKNKTSSKLNLWLKKASNVSINVSGIPVYAGEGYQQATVLFAKEAAVDRALNLEYESDHTFYDDNDTLRPVSEVWKQDLHSSYNIDCDSLLERCTDYMKEYDLKKQKEEKVNRKVADEPDADGWITVTRNKFSRPPKAVKAHELKKLRKKKESTALLHFYKNQITDTKMHRIRELKAKFEQDKKKIQEMRQQRKFKPY